MNIIRAKEGKMKIVGEEEVNKSKLSFWEITLCAIVAWVFMTIGSTIASVMGISLGALPIMVLFIIGAVLTERFLRKRRAGRTK